MGETELLIPEFDHLISFSLERIPGDAEPVLRFVGFCLSPVFLPFVKRLNVVVHPNTAKISQFPDS